MLSFSIIICTHNPNLTLLERLLDAVANFEKSGIKHEVILIDNNSTPALSANKAVHFFLNHKSESRIINQTKPGLTPSRVRGIKEAKYEWLIFFDDDNEPEVDYLNKAQGTIAQYIDVGIWGPGDIEVIYTEQKDEWINTKKSLFQQRKESVTRFAHQELWQPCYPFGTGMIIKKEIAEEYARRVEQGRYTLSDRKGKSLASGGDVQMVLTGIDMGYSAGVIAGLKLNHLIDSSKSNLKYLRKQEYGTASAFVKAFNQVFYTKSIPLRYINNLEILKKVYSIYRIYRPGKTKADFELLMASKMGEINAVIFASGQAKPLLLRLYEKLIHA